MPPHKKESTRQKRLACSRLWSWNTHENNPDYFTFVTRAFCYQAQHIVQFNKWKKIYSFAISILAYWYEYHVLRSTSRTPSHCSVTFFCDSHLFVDRWIRSKLYCRPLELCERQFVEIVWIAQFFLARHDLFACHNHVVLIIDELTKTRKTCSHYNLIGRSGIE